jgi:hypothetical protein
MPQFAHPTPGSPSITVRGLQQAGDLHLLGQRLHGAGETMLVRMRRHHGFISPRGCLAR